MAALQLEWSDIKNIKGITEEKLRHKKCDGKILTPSAVKQINAFVNEVRIGDKVIASTSGKGIYAVGTIIGDYEFNDKLEYKHSRKVQMGNNVLASCAYWFVEIVSASLQ